MQTSKTDRFLIKGKCKTISKLKQISQQFTDNYGFLLLVLLRSDSGKTATKLQLVVFYETTIEKRLSL